MKARYRVCVFGEPRAPWRDSVQHAMDDAIAAGLAAYDEERREYYLPVPASIQTAKATNEKPPPAETDGGSRLHSQ